jgi:hypothetical protein
MQGEKSEHWMELCQQASIEQNPQKLIQLIRAINNMLEEKRARLNRVTGDKKTT